MKWKFWRRRSPDRLPAVVDDEGAPVQVAGVWYAGGAPVRGRGVWSQAGLVWRHRLGGVARVVQRAAGWALGVETRGRVEQRSITSLPWVQGGPSGSGASVTVERALGLGPVFAAGRLLSSNVASLPLETFRATPSGRVKLPTPALFTKPSVQGGLHDWVQRCMTSLVYRGNVVGLITSRDRLEYPTGIEWLHPDYVQVIDSIPQLGQPGSYTNPLWYYLGKPIAAENIVHIPWFTVAGRVWGLSPLGAYAATVTTGLAAQDYSAEWFTNGGVPPGTFANANQVVDQNDAEIIKARLVASIRSRQPIVYGKDWQYTPISVPASEAKFVDTLKLGATQIAAIYGIPPEMIGGETGNSMTYSNTEQQAIQFVTFTLLPWLTKLEDAFNALLPRGQYVKFNVDALLRVDAKTRFVNYEKSRLIGLENIDEIRDQEDKPPLPDGKGADYTPLPLLAGTSLTVPQVRSDDVGDFGRPRLVKEERSSG